jgi:hypothetical protein
MPGTHKSRTASYAMKLLMTVLTVGAVPALANEHTTESQRM